MQIATIRKTSASPAELAIWLCHAYVAVPPTKESAPVRKQSIDKLLAAHGAKRRCAASDRRCFVHGR